MWAVQCLVGVQLHQAKLRQHPLQGVGEEQLVLGAGVLTVGLFIPKIVQDQLLALDQLCVALQWLEHGVVGGQVLGQYVRANDVQLLHHPVP